MEESIILAVEVDTKKALTQIDLLAQSVEEAKKRQEELNQQFKEGAISREDYNKATKENTKEIKAAETATKNLTTAVKSEAGSINDLNARNKELMKQRNALGILNDSNRDKFKQLNDEINKNNDLIKANVSNLEKQRLNIGNYSSALEGISGSLKSVVPGLGGMTNGIMGITTGAKAFTATPFGATLQVIAGLLTVLIEAFKGSEEGQRNLNKVTQVTTALFGALGDVVRNIGGLLIDAFKNPKQTMMDLVEFLKNNLVNRFKAFGVIIEGIKNLDFKQVANGALQLGSGIENTIEKIENIGKSVIDVANKALEQGNKVAKLQAEIEDLEDEANLRRAKNDRVVAMLRERSIKEEGETKRKTIEEAIRLEKQSADFSVQIAQKKVELAKEELAISTDKKKATDNLEDAEVALQKAKTEGYLSTLKFEKEIRGLNEQEIKNAELDAQIAKRQEQEMDDELTKIVENLNKENEAKAQKLKKDYEIQLESNNKEAEAKYLFEDLITRTTLDEETKRAIMSLDLDYQTKLNYLKQEEEFQEQRNDIDRRAQEKRQINEAATKKAIEKISLDTLNFITNTVNRANQKRVESYKKLYEQGKISEEQLNQLTQQSAKRYRNAALAEIAINYGIGLANAIVLAQEQSKKTDGGFLLPVWLAQQIGTLLATISKARAVVDSANFSGGSSISGGGISVSGGRSGVTATQATTNPINQTYSAANAFRNMPPVVASWQEATTVRNRVEFKEQLTTA